jgi:hypothetical protein
MPLSVGAVGTVFRTTNSTVQQSPRVHPAAYLLVTKDTLIEVVVFGILRFLWLIGNTEQRSRLGLNEGAQIEVWYVAHRLN